MSDDVRDNIVQISAKFANAAPIARKDKPYQRLLDCPHEHGIVDEVLRTVTCRDCGQERLDPIECLLNLARKWERWQYEAKMLRDLNVQYETNERQKWERARDRHLGAHPTHVVDPFNHVWMRGCCRICQRLEVTCPQSVLRSPGGVA